MIYNMSYVLFSKSLEENNWNANSGCLDVLILLQTFFFFFFLVTISHKMHEICITFVSKKTDFKTMNWYVNVT